MDTATERGNMMSKTPPVSELFKNFIPITDLNKGKASQIIDELKKTGYKVILKNNRPEAVLITPAQFEEMLAMREEMEEMALALEALRRLEGFDPAQAVSHDDVLAEFGLSPKELDEIEVEIS